LPSIGSLGFSEMMQMVAVVKWLWLPLALNISEHLKNYLRIYAIYLCYRDHRDQNV